MRHSLVILSGAILAMVAITASAKAQSPGDRIEQAADRISRGIQERVERGIGRGGYQPYVRPRYRWRPDPYPYPYPPYDYGWGGYAPYPYYPPNYGPYPYPYPYPYYAPLTIPSETLYGPQATLRFMGLGNWFAPQTNLNVLVVPNQNAAAGGAVNPGQPPVPPAQPGQPPAQPPQPGQAPPQPGPVPLQPAPGARLPAAGQPQPRTNQETLALAWKYIGYGDAHFGNQRYPDANVRYRKATRVAPQLADGWFRQGFAMTATQRYDLAALAFKRGLGLEPDWPKSDFRLGELYGGNAMAKTAHIDALADAAVKAPTDGDLLFIVGVFLHFDGQQQRAKPFFQRALQMAGADGEYIKGFLR